MQRQDKLIVHYLTKTFEHIPDGDKETGKQIRFASFFALLVLLSLFLTGSEAVKVTLRKKTGLGEISFIRLFLTFIFLLLFGILLLTNHAAISDDTSARVDQSGTSSFFIGGLFYISFAIFLAVMGVLNKLRAKTLGLPEMYPGSCRFLEKAEKKSSLRRSNIRNVWHPVIFFAVGVCLFFIHPLLGLPLAACAFSYWIVFVIEFTAGFEDERLAAIIQYDPLRPGLSYQPSTNVSGNIPKQLPNPTNDISSITDKW
jgi:hypothetical protein